jgi:hypothetical protein
MTRKEFIVNACLAIAGNSAIVHCRCIEFNAKGVIKKAIAIADELEEREYFDD